jgi:oligoendopeptidase F
MRTTFSKSFSLFMRRGLLVSLILSVATGAFAQSEELKERSQIPEKYTWNLKDMYASDDAWQADVTAIENMIPTLKGFEGKISKSPDQLLAFFKADEDISKKMDNAGSYAFMAYDQDTREQKYTGFKDRFQQVAVKVGEATSWFTPELVSIPDATLEQWYKDKPELAVYRQYIGDQLRTRAHTLSPAEERILALSGNLAAAPGNAATALRNTDLQFPTIKDENGKDVQLSEGRYAMLLESQNRDVRRDAMVNMLNTYKEFQNTAAALMTGNIAKDLFYANSRHYHSALEASLDNDNVDTTVYLNLIETVKKNIEPLRKYSELRREALKLPDIHLYDYSVALIPETRTEVPFDQAVATIEKALAPLGKEYLDPMEKGFASRWIDVYETKGKRSGAYSSGSYTSHPYMLLNYNNTLDDMFTVAHEMGHSMHTWFSAHNQPYIYSDYRIFVAEVASTFNEALLMDYLLKNEKDPAKKLYLVNQYLDNIRGTVIAQVIFADFELKMHRASEAGEALTSDNLSKMYEETIKEYYGPKVAWDDEYAYTWIRIPHFYRNFYVYKYATSYAASQALSQKVLNKEKGAREAYIHFLSSGSSEYPLDLLRRAGVDMSKPAAVEATMKKFSELVDQMEKLLIQTGKIPAPKKG